jgi:uncharacterized protein (TIGR02246 family)
MAASTPGENHQLFEKLANAGDVEGLLDLYEEDAIYVPTRGQRLQGREQIREVLTAMTASGHPTRLELLELVEIGDVALERTRWTIEAPGEDGKPATVSGNSTVVLCRQTDGSWRMRIDDPGLG